jgi:hypothetical protein
MDLLASFLPDNLLVHFEVVEFKELGNLCTRSDCFYIYLDEKNILPTGYDVSEFESKGFGHRTTLQDFPIRGKSVYLLIRRRRWRSKINPNIEIKSAYPLVADGSKLTVELAAFLKDTGRY